RYGVVVQDLVGDVDAGGDRLAQREYSRVEVGTVTEILEDVRAARKPGLCGPVDSLAAHLNQSGGVALHPGRHEVAADACVRDRALGYACRGIVRTARTEVGSATDSIGRVREYLRRDEVDHHVARVERGAVSSQPLG